MSGSRVVEVKRALDGSERRFECELVASERSRVIVLFRFTRDGQVVDSYGFFWRRRGYNCYYAVLASSEPRALELPVFVRFDVVRDVEFDLEATPPEVRYTDLLLDLWVDAEGARWEDEDEVALASANGTISAADRTRIEATRALLTRRHRRIAREVRAALRALGVAL